MEHYVPMFRHSDKNGCANEFMLRRLYLNFWVKADGK